MDLYHRYPFNTAHFIVFLCLSQERNAFEQMKCSSHKDIDAVVISSWCLVDVVEKTATGKFADQSNSMDRNDDGMLWSSQTYLKELIK